MKRQAAFRGAHKRKQVLKGASTLSLDEFKQYDTSIVHDHESKSSEKVAKSGIDSIIHLEGDHDVWVEKILTSKKTGKPKVFFISEKTGQKVANEPPTGATRVFYLRDSFKETKLSSIVPEQNVKTPKSPRNVAELQYQRMNKSKSISKKCVSSAIAGHSEACEGQGTNHRPTIVMVKEEAFRTLSSSRKFEEMKDSMDSISIDNGEENCECEPAVRHDAAFEDRHTYHTPTDAFARQKGCRNLSIPE